MAFLHCHDCDWSQDDFYSVDGYNPSSSLKDWNQSLCEENIDKQFTIDSNFIRENGNITTREVIARDYEKYADRIRKMKWITFEQWQAESEENKVCPNCQSKNLDID